MLKLDTSRSQSVSFVFVDITYKSIKYKWKQSPFTYCIYGVSIEELEMFGDEKISIGWLLNMLQNKYAVYKVEEINTSKSSSVDFIYYEPDSASLIYKWKNNGKYYVIDGVSTVVVGLLKYGKFSIGALLNQIQSLYSPQEFIVM